MPRYHFDLFENKLLSRASRKPTEITTDEISQINIASVTDTHNGWVCMVSDKYKPKDSELIDEGK